jgi:hypothetical protein
MKNLQDFEENMELLNTVLDKLIQQAFETQQEADIEELETRDYSKMENPSLLRFLVDMRGEEVRNTLNTAPAPCGALMITTRRRCLTSS